MPTYRLWTPDDTYRGTIDAETPAKALLQRHREDRDFAAELDGSSLDYDPDIDAIVWPDDQTCDELGDVDDWRIEPADD
jgi:hypothetical protein